LLDGGDFENQQDLPQTVEDNGSSNFAFDDTNQTDETVEKEEEPEEETFIADLAEENANSFPSACDEVNSAAGQDQDSNNQNENSTGVQDSLDSDVQMVEEDKSEEDTFAQSEDIKMKDDQATDLDAENISEDELPQPEKPKVKDAEEVSDEELPGPKLAELPADTEVVSEEELPQTTPIKKEAKRKLEDYDPSEPTAVENDAPEKKVKREPEGKRNFVISRVSRINVIHLCFLESSEKKYRLPDLEKYWKAVKADTEDFNAWTILLQYVDSESDVEAAREAYDSFLSRYCYCYGYWRKYADYEKKKGSAEKCDEVSSHEIHCFTHILNIYNCSR
jgi:pre-mRNA-processing factor 39